MCESIEMTTNAHLYLRYDAARSDGPTLTPHHVHKSRSAMMAKAGRAGDSGRILPSKGHGCTERPTRMAGARAGGSTF
jgi:hypothetical protein